ncbi:MAG: transposase [Candidatus Helarchaeota archaeon]
MPYRQKIDFPEVSAPFSRSFEFKALQAYSSARGYLKHVFQFNLMNFWENINLNRSQKQLYRTVSMEKVFKLEMARYKLGFHKYKDWIKYLNHTPVILDAVDVPINKIPSFSIYGKLVHHLGSENVEKYFLELVEECLKFKLIDFKIIIWDGRSLESFYAKNPNKKLEAFSDHSAGMYKHVGKFKGLGYVDSTIVCAKYNLPIFFKSFPGNRNDNIIFRHTFNEYSTLNFPSSQILIADSGPYSNALLKLVNSHGIVPLIMARKNFKENVIKIGTRKYVNISQIHPPIIPYLEGLLNLRTGIERSFSLARFVYNADRMNNRGIENSLMNMGKLKCIELLTAITAVKVRRPDLINCPTAFSDFRHKFSVSTLKIPQFEKFNSFINGAKIEA